MINRKGDIINSLVTAIIMLLFVLLFSSFSDKSYKQTSSSSQYEFKSELHSSHSKAVIIDNIKLPSIQKSVETILLNTNFNLFKDYFKIIADNRRVTQIIISLQKTQQLIDPIPVCWIHLHLTSIDSEELPILS